jgi:hypothetical protein
LSSSGHKPNSSNDVVMIFLSVKISTRQEQGA